jgi:hypothetical protein
MLRSLEIAGSGHAHMVAWRMGADAEILAAARRAADEAIACNRKVHELRGTVTALRLQVAILRVAVVPMRWPLGFVWLTFGVACAALGVAVAALR